MYLFIVIFTIFTILASTILQSHEKAGRYIAFIYIFILSLIFGLRYDVGKDYSNYEFYFNYLYDTFNSEIGYSLLNYIVHYLGWPFYIITLFMSFTTNFLVYYGIIRTGLKGPYLNLSLVIYASNYMLLSLNGMRQALAAAILFFCFIHLYNSQTFKFIKGSLIGSLFHISSLLLVFLPFISTSLKSKKTIAVLFASMILTFFLVWFFDFSNFFKVLASYVPLYDYYSEVKINSSVGSIGLGVILRFILGVTLVSLFIIYSNKYSNLERMAVSLYLIGLIFNFLSTSNFMWGRIGMYFYIYEVIAIPFIIAKTASIKGRTILFSITVLYSLIFLSSLVFIAKDDPTELFYRSIFESY